MKTTIYSILAAAACGMAFGQTAYTTPVGYVALGDTTAGQPACKASTDISISVPLNRPTEYAGTVLSTTATTIRVSGAPAWATNVWGVPGTPTPYFVTITSGTENGYIGLIQGNDGDTLTVTPVTGGSLISPNVSAGDTIRINKAWTLISMFPLATIPNGARVLLFSGTAPGINIANSTLITKGTSQWATGLDNADNTILYPGESFIMRAGSTQIASLVVSGEVPVAKSRTFIDKLTAPGTGQDTRLSFFSPVDEIIGNSGLNTALGLASGDRILAYDNNASGTNKGLAEQLTWSNTTQKWSIGLDDVTATYTLKAGRGYVFRRASSAAAGAIDWKDAPSYLPLP